MNQKEVSELRRRFRPDKNAVSRIYGCYVNSNREIVSYLDESLGSMPQDEAEKYLSLLKKSLSGTLGRNLIDLVFSTQQVADSEEHRLLMSLRDSKLKDHEARETFYRKVIDSLELEPEIELPAEEEEEKEEKEEDDGSIKFDMKDGEQMDEDEFRAQLKKDREQNEGDEEDEL